uniref:Cytochrome P450 n=1 Tax=Pyrodinium bahamense TaxID=73915 RepID=A0A7S0AG25_9DINO
MDAFCEIAYGFPWNSMNPQEAPTPNGTGHAAPTGWFDIVLGAPDTHTEVGRMLWGRHFDRAQEISAGRSFRPSWKLERLLVRAGVLPARSLEGMLRESMQYVDRVIYKILDARFQEPEAQRAKRNDLLSLFMGVTQDRKYLRDIAVNFLLAGRDTTATTLTWLFWEVARCEKLNLGVLARMREEVAREAGAERSLSFQALSRMRFCGACVRETVRLHAVVPLDGKTAVADDVLPDGTLVARGDMVFFHPYCMARDPGLWGPDAAEWRPDRWLEMEHEPSTFLDCVFQAGPRICLGKEMALLEAKTVLAHLVLAGLSWSLPPGPDGEPPYKFPSVTLTMADPGLWLNLKFDDAPRRAA